MNYVNSVDTKVKELEAKNIEYKKRLSSMQSVEDENNELIQDLMKKNRYLEGKVESLIDVIWMLLSALNKVGVCDHVRSGQSGVRPRRVRKDIHYQG